MTEQPVVQEPTPSGKGSGSGVGGTILYILIGIVIALLILLLVLVLVRDGGEGPSTGEPAPMDTPIPPPLPTEGPTPTPISGDPRDILGSPVFLDTFDDDRNWDVYDNDCFRSVISDGQFNMTAKGKPEYVTITCWELTWPKVTDYYLEVVATAPDECEGIDRWGLFFRGPNTQQGYALLLTCDGRYVMANINGKDVHFISGPATSGAINAGPGETNRIGVGAKGNNFWIYMNGVKLAEVQDSAYTSGDRIGLAVGSSNTVDMKVQFDDFAYWQLP
jgi:hypothetical protein